MSGGMAQRIVIAIALICSPKFIVSDDATSGLDVTVQAQVLELLRRLVLDRGSSMLFITRDIGIAAHFCHRVAVMYDGEIIELATREDFFFRPPHPYTVMLMAAFSHNPRLRRMWSRPDLARPTGQGVETAAGAGSCRYVGRCPLAQERCRRAPDLARVGARPFRPLPFSGPPMTPLLEVRQLTKHFPVAGSRSVVQAVNGISFTLAPGETLGLVGESGSGKTTVGRCILSLTNISGGTSASMAPTLATRRQKPGSLRGQMQIVFQEPADALDPRLRIGASSRNPCWRSVSARTSGGTGSSRRSASSASIAGRCGCTRPNSAPASNSASASPGR